MNWFWVLAILTVYLAIGFALGANLLDMTFHDEGYIFFAFTWPIVFLAAFIMTIIDYIKQKSMIVNDKMAMKKFKKSLEENPEIVDDIDFKK